MKMIFVLLLCVWTVMLQSQQAPATTAQLLQTIKTSQKDSVAYYQAIFQLLAIPGAGVHVMQGQPGSIYSTLSKTAQTIVNTGLSSLLPQNAKGWQDLVNATQALINVWGYTFQQPVGGSRQAEIWEQINNALSLIQNPSSAQGQVAGSPTQAQQIWANHIQNGLTENGSALFGEKVDGVIQFRAQ